MASKEYTRTTERFKCYGLDLNSPLDAIRTGYYPVLENVRAYTDGTLQPRQGINAGPTAGIKTLGAVLTGQTPVHSVRRLNDSNTGTPGFILAVGAGTGLSMWDAGYTQLQYNSVNVLFSGNPLIMLPFRPDQSTSSWMYIADSLASYKVVGYNGSGITKGTVHKIGVAPPTVAPVVEIKDSRFGVITAPESTGGVGVNGWVKDNVVITTAPSAVSRVPAGTTTTQVIYDSGTSGWASATLPQAAMSVIGVGEVLYIQRITPTVVVPALISEVYAKSATVKVGAILYDSGANGPCIIQPDQPVKEIVRNSLVLLAGSVYARVTDIIPSQDEGLSFRCSTGSTINPGDALTVISSFRFYDNTGLTGLTTGGGDGVQDSVAFAVGAVSSGGAGTTNIKTGWLQITPVTPIDLSKFTLLGSTVGSATSDDDFVHLSFLHSDISKLVQGRIMLDCSSTSYTLNAVTNANPAVFTTTVPPSLGVGDTVFISGITGATGANGTWTVSAVSSTTFSVVMAAPGVYVSGGTVIPQFKDNFYYRAFTPNDLTPAVKGTQTALVNRNQIITNRNIDTNTGRVSGGARTIQENPEGSPPSPSIPNIPITDPTQPIPDDPSRSQAGTGDNQWSELKFRRSDLVRVGQDVSSGFSKLGALRIELTMTDTTAFTFTINSFTLWGTFALDSTGIAIPYIYRYRYRVSKTGAVSNWSPANRSGLLIQRGQSSITVTAPSGVPEVDKIDIQRIGGFNTTWLTIGTTPIGTLTFVDKVSDDAAAALATLSDLDTNSQPWPLPQKPATGTTVNSANHSVVGPYIKDSGTNFNLNWAKGTPIKINGIDTQIRRVVSTSVMEVDDSQGNQNAVTWEIPQPLLIGQPLPSMWEYNNTGFACGDTSNPGFLYFTNSNSLDSTQDSLFLEVTSPSEPLINGCSFNGRNYVWSSERMFEVVNLGPAAYIAVPIPGNKGLLSRWALAVGERIWYVSKDGIYQTSGGDSISITDQYLAPLFKKEGNVGVVVNGFNPPDLTNTSSIRLSYYDGYLYFTYKDSSAAYRTLTYNIHGDKQGWWPDVYANGITTLYGEEGQGVHSLLACGANVTTGKLYTINGTSDDGTAISCHFRTSYFDGGDRRANKHWGDFILDADPNNVTINLVTYTNAGTSTQLTLLPTSMTGAGRQQLIVDISAGGDPTASYARSIATDIQWSSTTATPILYLWEPSYTAAPETVDLRSTPWDDAGFQGDKFFQGIEIDADTGGVPRTIAVDTLDGTTQEILNVNHNGRQLKAYPFHPAFTTSLVRMRATDSANTWKLYNCRWIYQPEPPLANRWDSQQTSFGYSGFLHMKAMYIALSSGSPITLTITRTDDATTQTYTIPSTGNTKKKVYLPLAVTKGKEFSFSFTAEAPFRLYKQDTVVFTKSWNSEDAYSNNNIFGADYGAGQVQI